MAFIRYLQSLKLPSFLTQLPRFQKKPPVGLYNLHVVSLEEELEFLYLLPKEFRYALQKDPSLKNRIAKILKSGKAIGIRTVEKTPERVLSAINNIAVLSQHRTIITWLPRLLLSQTRPLLIPSDHELAAKNNVDLDEEIAVILSHRLDFKKFILVDDGNLGTTESDKKLIDELNEAISPIIIRHVTSRMVFDNADTRTSTGQAIITFCSVNRRRSRRNGRIVRAPRFRVYMETTHCPFTHSHPCFWACHVRRLSGRPFN